MDLKKKEKRLGVPIRHSLAVLDRNGNLTEAFLRLLFSFLFAQHVPLGLRPVPDSCAGKVCGFGTANAGVPFGFATHC